MAESGFHRFSTARCVVHIIQKELNESLAPKSTPKINITCSDRGGMLKIHGLIMHFLIIAQQSVPKTSGPLKNVCITMYAYITVPLVDCMGFVLGVGYTLSDTHCF